MTSQEDCTQKMDIDPARFCLMSNDKRRFLVEKDVVYCSCMIKNMMQTLGLDETSFSATEPIYLPNVDGETLEAIITWSERHRGEPSPSDRARPSYKELSSWDKEFINNFQGKRLESLLDAASYLDVKSLVKAVCSVIAKDFEKSSVADIRQRYNIVNDFTEDEERQLRLESTKMGLE